MTPDTCRNNHPWTPENTGRNNNGKRYCKACQRARTLKNRAARQGQPCGNCGRTGIHIATGGWCITCCRRRAKGQPLDAPISTPKATPAATPKPKKPRATKPQPAPTPTPVASNRLPATWWDNKPAKKRRTQPGLTSHAPPEVGPVEPTPEDTLTAAYNVLASWHALDLADILGLTPGAAA